VRHLHLAPDGTAKAFNLEAASLRADDDAEHVAMSHLRTYVLTVIAALAAALIGRWLFGGPSVLAALFIGAVAAAITIIAIELLDRPPRVDAPAQRTATPAAVPPPVSETAWWDSSTATSATPAVAPPVVAATVAAPVAAAPTSHAAPIDLERWRAAANAPRQFQCPRCGGFAVVRTTGEECACRECAARWTWRKGTPWPRVVIDVRTRARGAAPAADPPNQPSSPRG
jgi:hypothetical protein